MIKKTITLKSHERLDRLEKENIDIIQSREVFSFSLDAVLLADFATIAERRKANIVDLCSGNGAVAFILSHKTANPITAVEIQEQLYDMAMRTTQLNGLEDRVTFIHQDIRKLKGIIPKDSVDYITCNPPYFKVKETNLTNLKEAYTIARHEVHLPLEDLLSTISRLLKMKGKAYLVHRPDRLSDILTEARQHRLEAKRVQFVYPKEGKESNIVLIELMKDGLPGGLKVLPPITVFNEQQEYTEKIRSILWGDKA